MLNYGTAAQLYFNRNADAPANEAFEIFKNYESYTSADLSASLEDMYSMTENAGVTGKLNLTLDLGARVGITYKVTLPDGVDAADANGEAITGTYAYSISSYAWGIQEIQACILQIL